MEKEFVPYELTVKLKQLGFDEPCFAWYVSKSYGLEIGKVVKSDLIKDAIVAPTFSQAFRWFREEHDLFGCIDLQVCTPPHWFVRIDEISKNDYIFHSEDEKYKFSTYEGAELACLGKLIGIVGLINNPYNLYI